MNWVITCLSSLAIIGTFITLEADRRTRAMIGLFISNAAVGLIFLQLHAIYAGLFQLLIYAGVLVILFLSTAALLDVQGEEEKEEKENTLASGSLEDRTHPGPTQQGGDS